MPDNRNRIILNIYNGAYDAVIYDIQLGFINAPNYVDCATPYTGSFFYEVGSNKQLYLYEGGNSQPNYAIKQFDPAGAGCTFWTDQPALTPNISGQSFATPVGVPIDYLNPVPAGCTGI